MVWSIAYETGNKTVDKDHKEIFSLVKKVLDAAFASKKEKIDETVKFLTNYTVRHFENEEKLMDESDYPEKEAHKEQHTAFVQSVIALAARIAGEQDITQISLAVNDVIVDWLTEHVLGSDKLLADHYKVWQKNNASGEGK